MKKKIVSVALCIFVLAGAHAQKSEVYIADGKAIKGYDPVAFFTESRPVKGSEKFHTMWMGAEWDFTSQKDLDMFKADPKKYAPQYGGYCAYGAAKGKKAPTETETWTIFDGKLYLNYNMDVKEMWSKDKPGYIQKANQQWTAIKDKE